MSTTSPPASVAVLDSAVTWTHSCLQLARTSDLMLPTPCSGWNLGDLLAHMEDSLEALSEALAAEVGSLGITVTVIQPGAFHTAIDQKLLDTPPSTMFPGVADMSYSQRPHFTAQA